MMEKKIQCGLLLLLWFLWSGQTSAQILPPDLQKTLDLKVEAMLPEMVKYRRYFHQNPELAYQEEQTSQYIAGKLEDLGYTVYRQYGGGTGVAGVLHPGKKPFIGIRADIDALPVTEQVDIPYKSTKTTEYEGQVTGVSHACGHDVHAATALTVAEMIADDEDFEGSVMFIFQPAEEGGRKEGLKNSGAAQMLTDGLFEDLGKPEVLFSFHVVGAVPSGYFGVKPGVTLANSNFFEIKLKGKQGHGSSPWNTKDPIVCAAEIITNTQTIVSREANLTKGAAVVTYGLVQGGIRENIIPEEVVMKGTIRNLDVQNHEWVISSLEKKIQAIAGMNDIEATFKLYNPVPLLNNDPRVSERTRTILETIVPKKQVIEPPAGTGYDDVSYFLKEVPGVYYIIGVGDPSGKFPLAGNHSPDFYVDENSFHQVLSALTYLVYDYATHPFLSSK